MLSIQRSFKENKILNNPISVPAHYNEELDELNSIDILTKNHYHHHTIKQLHSWTTELLALNPCGTKVCAIPNDRLEVNNMPRSWVWLVTRIVYLIVDLVTNSVISQNGCALTDIHCLIPLYGPSQMRLCDDRICRNLHMNKCILLGPITFDGIWPGPL